VKPVVEVSHLSKRFRLPLDKSTTLKYRVTHWRSTSRYRDLHALRDVSFQIPQGQFLGIAGPNGCGKSTLLKILCRIYKASAGSAVVNGEFSAFLELGVGFNPELTARENVFLGGAVLGLTRAQLRDKIDEVFAFAVPPKTIGMANAAARAAFTTRRGCLISAAVPGSVASPASFARC